MLPQLAAGRAVAGPLEVAALKNSPAYRILNTVKPLEMPDAHYLAAAVGWLGLDNWPESVAELENIAPEFQTHPDVLNVRWAIYAKAGQWDKAAEFAKIFREAHRHEPQAWIHLAYATRRMPEGGLLPAKDILVKARQLFPDEAIIPYNLACYDCQLGNLKDAREWLQKAFAIGDPKDLIKMAAADPDLEPLRDEIGKP